MKFTLSWLKEHLDTNVSLNEITDKLTAIGLELESVEDPSKDFAPFKAAYVESAEQHPDADRLKVCIVDTGSEKVQVICGAPNARQGMKGIFAPAGSYIPGTDMMLKKGKIRGQESNGMLLSEREMGLSDEHDGIIDLPEDTKTGTPASDVLGMNDPVIDIAITPNRGDCTSVYGVARDLAAAGMGKLTQPDDKPVKGKFKSPVGVDIQTPDTNPLFIGRYIKGVKNGPSPDWLQKKLKAIGLRPISILVDITNYMTMAYGRPLHVYDADRLTGDIHVRLSKKGESFAALNDKSYCLEDDMTAICDDSGLIGLGGIVGGVSTGCEEDTVNVFVESAYFDPLSTARTGRKLQIESDARYRFERGIDPEFTATGMEIATKLIMELCGGEPSELVIAGKKPEWERSIEFDPDFVTKLAGFEIDVKEQKTTLEALGFEISGKGSKWKVEPPSWRGDIEGRADLVEEIVRIHGFDNIPPVSLRSDHAVSSSAETPSLTKARRARTELASRGMNECVTWSFMPRPVAEMFGANDHQAQKQLTLTNPISSELDQMRPSILPNLIEAAGKNADKGQPNAALFEVGPAFDTAKANGQKLVATGLRHSARGARHWSGDEASRDIDVFDVKADALAVLEACGGPAQAQITRDAPDYYHPGRSGAIRLGKNVLAYFGDIHPAILDEMDTKAPVCGFEVFLNAIPQSKNKGPAKKLLKLSQFQPVERDFAFIVDQNIEADNIIRAAKSADKDLITTIDVFDIYQGKGVEDGKKSVAINVTLQPNDHTLTDAEIDEICKKIIDAVASKTGGFLRG